MASCTNEWLCTIGTKDTAKFQDNTKLPKIIQGRQCVAQSQKSGAVAVKANTITKEYHTVVTTSYNNMTNIIFINVCRPK